MGTRAADLFASWPAFTTVTWLAQALAVMGLRRSECPSSRSTTYYIRQSGSGDGTGGGGLGTEASPFLVRDLADLSDIFTLYEGTGNVAFLLERGGVFRGSASPTLDKDNCTLGAWGSGSVPPVITGFQVDDGTGWTDTGTGAYWKTYTTAHWVRLRNNYPALMGGTETVFTKQSSQATVEANNNSFWLDTGASRLYVRIGANQSPNGGDNLIEVCQTNNKGVYVSQADGCRIENLLVVGFGMGTVASQNYNIHVDVRDTDSCYVYNCHAYYSGHHVVGHLVSGGGNGGGLTLWENCEFGLGRADSNGDGTMFVAYSNDGEHEWILKDSRCRYGILPDVGSAGWSATTVKRGSPFYGHADSPDPDGAGPLDPIPNETAFALVYRFTTDDHTYGCKTSGNIGNPDYWDSSTTNRGVLTNYKAWIIGEVFNGGNNTLLNVTYQHVAPAWCYLKDKPAAASTADIFLSAGAATRAISAWIGVNIERDWSLFTGSGAVKAWNRNSVAQYLDIAYCTFRNIGCVADYYVWDPNNVAAPWGSTYNRVFNTVWSTTAGTALRPNVHLCPNATPSGAGTGADTAVTGGGRDTAWWRTGTTAGVHTVYGPADFSADYVAHDQHPGYIDLTGEQGRLTVPASGGQLFQQANTADLPFAVEWWMDSSGNVRRMPTLPSIGSVQQSSPLLFASKGSLAARALLLELV